jgi:anthranilate/para-aminobenzoate synthase component I
MPDPRPLDIRLLGSGDSRQWHFQDDSPAFRHYIAHVDPFDTLDRIDQTWQTLPADIRLIGVFSYELARHFESLPARHPSPGNWPLIAFSEHLLQSGRPMHKSPIDSGRPEGLSTRTSFRPRVKPDDFQRSIQRAIDYIAAGDVFQVNLTQRFDACLDRMPSGPCAQSADEATALKSLLLRAADRLTAHPHARFGAYLDWGDFAVLSHSPELFLRIEQTPAGRRIVTRPIKGTRPIGPGMRDALEASAKDRAELAMIVDLLRNDLGRICRVGTVRVTEPREIEAHPTVLHTSATIEGILRDDITLTDILRATFPCGSITGCPKIRAMQIIDELEPHARGPYCGAIGWLGAGGTLELSVAIRTATYAHGSLWIDAGGGIVADSCPLDEYGETLVKCRSLLDGLSMQLDLDELAYLPSRLPDRRPVRL